MKIRIPAMTLDIDPEAWEMAFGVGKDDIREDVREFVKHRIYESLTNSGEGFLIEKEG